MRLRRISPKGLLFYLDTVCSDKNQTRVTCAFDGSEIPPKVSGQLFITVNANLDTMNQAWYNWQMKGQFIQTAFHFLNAEEREFILTGVTPDQWNLLFPDDDDVKDSKD